jgi:WD40 repeat protein
MPISQENAAKVSALADWMTDPVIDLAWAPNVYQLVVAHPASIVFYDLANRAKLRQLYPQAAEIVDIDFSPDGKWLVSGSSRLSGDDLYTSNLELWVGPDWKPLGILYGQQGGLTGLGFSQNSQEFLVSYTLPEPEQSGWVDFWRVPAWKIANRLETGTILAFAASSQVSRLATTPNRYSIIIWDMEKRQLLFNLFTSFTGAVHRMVFSPDRILLATGHYDGNIRLWDALSGVLLLEIKNEGVIDSLAFTPDGSVLVAGLSGSEPVILLYSSSTGQLLNQLKGHASAVTSLLFSPDGQLFASGSYDGEIRLWGIRP